MRGPTGAAGRSGARRATPPCSSRRRRAGRCSTPHASWPVAGSGFAPRPNDPPLAESGRVALLSKTTLISGAVSTALASAGAGAWYQLFRRPLPKTSGRLRLRGLEAPVEILRDRFGVPHIRARGVADACFALG